MKKAALLILFYAATILSQPLMAQCYIAQPLESRLEAADLVVSGRVVESVPFWDRLGQISTRHQIEVLETWHGNAELSRLSLVTKGGRINEELTVVQPALSLTEGELGVFLLRKKPRSTNAEDFFPVAVHESLISINPTMGTAYDSGNTYNDLDQLYEILTNHFSIEAPFIRQELVRSREPQVNGWSEMMPSIINFTPTTVNAGTGVILTINGSGFGSTQGNVFFDSPDDGPGGSLSSVPSDAFVSWTDTQIQVEVTGNAGTGNFIVQTSGGVNGFSPQPLNVPYAIQDLNVGSGYSNGRLVDDEGDGNGGYSYLLSTSTANNGEDFTANGPARDAMGRAFNTWQQTGYAIYAGVNCGTTTVQAPVQGDGVNVISFDNNAYDLDVEAGAGVVGQAFFYYNFCGGSELEMTGNDIIMRRNGDPNGFGGSVNWFYGTGPGPINQNSFEAVALHEIGHTHQLKHVNDDNQVMFFQTTAGQALTSLGSTDLQGATFVENLGLSYSPICGTSGDYTTYQPAADCAPLPVSLISFYGQKERSINRLYWRTANETNNDYFSVERSADGRSFQSFGRVNGAGSNDTERQYELDDTQPLNGDNYYRLAQVDFDGTVNYSPVILLTNEVAGGTTLSSAPNPFDAELTVENLSADLREVSLLNVNGQLVARYPIDKSVQIVLPTASLPSGVYWLRAGSEVQKVIKR